MSDEARSLLTFLLGASFFKALGALIGEDRAVYTILALVLLIWSVASVAVRAQARLSIWRATQALRRMPAAERLELLETLDANSRRILHNGLARDGSEAVDGVVERFPFPARRARLAELLLVATLTTGIALLLVAGFADVDSNAMRWALLLSGVTAVPLALCLNLLHGRLMSVIEVSPFQVVEIAASGRRTAMSFNQPLILLNEPRWHRMQLTSVAGPRRMTLHYGRMGFWRLADRIVEYGRFRESPDAISGDEEG